jgi:hypothetical protein
MIFRIHNTLFDKKKDKNQSYVINVIIIFLITHFFNYGKIFTMKNNVIGIPNKSEVN